MSGDIARRLRGQGYRLTPQRLMVLEVLADSGHTTAEAIQERVARRYPFINLSTVYRTLDMLTAEGVVRLAHGSGDRRVYEIAGEAEQHHHLICRSCGRVEHVEVTELDALKGRVLRKHAFHIDETQVTSLGLCRKCRSEA